MNISQFCLFSLTSKIRGGIVTTNMTFSGRRGAETWGEGGYT